MTTPEPGKMYFRKSDAMRIYVDHVANGIAHVHQLVTLRDNYFTVPASDFGTVWLSPWVKKPD
jgi:hypothetical protein